RDARHLWRLIGLSRCVGNAEAATEVELGDVAARELRKLGVHAEQAAGRLAKTLGREDLGADVAVQADKLEGFVAEDLRNELRRISKWVTELLILVRGREKVVGRGVHATVDAQSHTLHAP